MITEKKIYIYLIGISLFIKLAYLTVPLTVSPEYRNANVFSIYLKYAKNNDSWWYQKIIDNGYSKISSERELGYCEWPDFKQSEWAFFPMYPILIKSVSATSGLSSNITSAVVSFILSTLAMIAVFKLALLLYNDKKRALFISILLFIFPFHFYFSAFYTEALFLCLLVFSFIAIKKEKHILLSLLLIPLVLTRPNGLVAMLPLYLYFLECHKLLAKYRLDLAGIFKQKNILTSLFFISGVLAFAAYCYYQYSQTGFYNAFSIAQRGWEKKLTFPFLSLFSRSGTAHQFHSAYTLVAMIFAIISWRKMPISFNTLVWTGLLLPLSGGSVISMARYISVLFPLFFILGDLIYKLKARYIILAVLFLVQLYTLSGFVKNLPICY